MGKFKYTLSNIWFWIVIAIGCFLMQSVYFFTVPGVSYDHEAFWILVAAGLISMGVYFYLEHKNNNLKVDKVLLPIFIIVFVLFTISLWTQDGEVFIFANGEGQNDIAMSVAEKIRYTVMLGFSMITAYMILFTHSHNYLSSKKSVWLPIAFVLFTIVNIVISLITEMDSYKSIFDVGSRHSEGLKSIYNNENMFGVIVLIGLCSCGVINYAKPNVPTFITMAIFFLWTLLIGSSTCIICAVVFIPFYIVIETFRGFKTKPIKTVIFLGSFIAIVIACIFIYSFCIEKEVKFFVNFEKYISTLTESTKGNFDDFTGRVQKWLLYINTGSDNVWHLLFGRGFNYNHKVITSVISSSKNTNEVGSLTPENGFVSLFMHGGLLALGCYIALCAYFVYCCVHLFIKKRRTFACLYLLLFVVMTMHNCIEDNLFMQLNGKETYITLAFFVPVIAAHKQLVHKNGEKIEAVKEMKIENKPIGTYEITTGLSTILFSVIAILIALVPTYTNYGVSNTLVYIFNIMFAAISCLIFLPYLIALMKKGSTTRSFIFQLITNLIFIFGIPTLIGVVMGRMPAQYSAKTLIVLHISLNVILAGYTFVYGFLRKGSFKEYFKYNFAKPALAIRYAAPASIITVTIVTAILKQFYTFSMNTFLTLLILAATIYFAVLFLVPNPQKNELEKALNDKDLTITYTLITRGKRNEKFDFYLD